MEETYATASLAVLRLVSSTVEESQHLESETVLRSVLQRRPVVLNFVVSTFARKLREGEDVQPSEVRDDRATAKAPHPGIRLALDAVLASYDPSAPHSIAAVIDALGEGRLKALVHTAVEPHPLLPWAARLCLVHACLASGAPGRWRWRWLSTAADSACSLALQSITLEGEGGSSTTRKGKMRARPSLRKRNASVEARNPAAVGNGRNRRMAPAVIGQVCAELAAADGVSTGPTVGGGFLSNCPGARTCIGAKRVSSACTTAGLLPEFTVLGERGGDWLQGFRFKLQALRDAILATTENDSTATQQHEERCSWGPRVVGEAEELLDGVDVLPEVVERALERSRCGEAFVFAVQAALEADTSPSATPENRKRKFSAEGRGEPVKLRRALEACLFCAGLPDDAGIQLDLVAISTATASTVGTVPPRLSITPSRTRRACAFLRGLATEGVCIRDLLRTLQDLHRGHDRFQGRPTSVGGGCSQQTGAEVVVGVRSPRSFRRLAVARVVGSFVEWLAGNPWVWAAAEGAEQHDFWERDVAAAALAVTEERVLPVGSAEGVGVELSGVLAEGAWGCHSRQCEGTSHSKDTWDSAASPADLLDRLVTGATAAQARANDMDWVDVLGRVITAGGSAPLGAYAAACVERSVALGGQAPFRVTEKQRLSQAGGAALWQLLGQACTLQGESDKGRRPTIALARTAAAAITACRKESCPWMVAPGLLGSGPLQLVIDMLRAASGSVPAFDVLEALLTRPGEDGAAFAADLFASITTVAAATSGACGGGDSGGSGLCLQAVTWLGNALSAAYPPAYRSNVVPTNVALAATDLTRMLTRRVPFESKPTLLAVEEAAKLAAKKQGTGEQCPNDQRIAFPSQDIVGGECLGSLVDVSRAAAQSPLLPLPVPSSPPLLPSEKDKDSKRWPVQNVEMFKEGKEAPGRGGGQVGATAGVAAVTAGLLLDAFVQSPVAVRRAVEDAVRRSDCTHELFAVQCALRLALCTPPAPARRHGRSKRGSGTSSSLLTGLGSRRAHATLLIGHLVEIGAPGWRETKAIMVPPLPQLMQAAEAPSSSEGAATLLSDSRRQFTALRLELWLRTQLRMENLCFQGQEVDAWIPDVFRTARALARAISRHASALGMVDQGGGVRSDSHSGFHVNGDRCSGDMEVSRSGCFEDEGSNRRDERKGEKYLKPPRQALASRLSSLPAAGALLSWVSNVVITAVLYKQWLPWQAFADELRELVLLYIQHPPQAASGGDKGVGLGGPAASAASVFAVCSLVLAWEAGEDVPAVVFGPTLCSSILSTAIAPVPPNLDPPIWLEVLRCIIDQTNCQHSVWSSPRSAGGARQDPLSIAAAASVWIGGGGPGPTARKEWMCWYGTKLRFLVPTLMAGSGKWLVISDTGQGGTGEVQVLGGGGWAARIVKPQEWEDWGRSPLQAAWNVPAGWEEAISGSDTGGAQPGTPSIVLPPFAVWLRVVLRGSPGCTVQGYLRRMAREVYLPCEFGGASGEMARQWLGALIEAEVGAEFRAQNNTTPVPGAASGRVEVVPCLSDGVASMATARRAAVNVFFREELLRFGSGEAPVAPVGGPLTWLWPLEAVVTACGRAGPLGGSMLARHGGGSNGPGREHTNVFTVDAPPTALARALCAVPHDLLCGSRRFGSRDGGRPPPATTRAFATRAVDLAARALATPPCRHWSVARRLLLGLGMLYHALAKPRPIKHGTEDESPGNARAGAVETGTRSACKDSEAAAAQTAALSTIENLVRIALGTDSGVDALRNGCAAGSVAKGPRHAGSFERGTLVLPSACRSLRSLEAGSGAGSEDFAEALRDAGAWRAAAAFFRPREVVQSPPLASTQSPAQLGPAVPRPSRHSLPKRGTATTSAQPVAGTMNSGASTAVCLCPGSDKNQRRSGTEHVCAASVSQVAPLHCPDTIKSSSGRTLTRSIAASKEVGPAPPPRRVLPVRATRSSDRDKGS